MVMMAHITEVTAPKVIISTYISMLSSIENKSHTWLLDSAASSHICGNIKLFMAIHEVPPISIDTASGESFTARYRGTVCITLQSDPSLNIPDLPLKLVEVIYVPNLNANLLSVGKMTNANVDVIFSKDSSSLTMDDVTLARGPKIHNLFTFMARPTEETIKYSPDTMDINLWHHRLTHMSHSTIERMARENTVIGLPSNLKNDKQILCTDCPYGKQTQAPFNGTEELPANIGDIVSSDICGPFETSIGGFKYLITWIDLSSRYSSVDFLKTKDSNTVTGSFKKYSTWIKRQKGTDIKRIRTDNGGEYIGKEFTDACTQMGIIHETTAPYTSEHNGIAERYNRTLQEGALTL